MNISEIKAILFQALQFILIIMAISFILDIGFDRLTKEPILELANNWLKSILKLSKLGIWVIISLIYSYFRVKQLQK